MSTRSVTIVGGGLAAVRTAQELRRRGHVGGIRILSAEGEPPYDRPPLSKKYLRGELPDRRLALWAPERFTEERVELRLGCAAVGLDPTAREVVMDDGDRVGYDQLVIATGASARRLPALAGIPGVITLRTAADARRLPALAGIPGVITLRTAADARQLAATVRAGLPVAVIGGGFIGLEVAATARELGCPVTVVEAIKAPLVHAIGLEAAEWLRRRHESEGVRFRCGTTVSAAVPGADGAVRLQLSDGSAIVATAVLVGVGVVRDCGWLAAAGLAVDDGLLCADVGRTNLPDIYGAGDIVRRRGHGPIGHWTSAGDSARRTAHGMMGLEPPAIVDDGYFWSDQYGMRVQFAGAATESSTLNVITGSLESGSFLAHCRTDGRLTGLLAVDQPREFVLAQHTMAQRLAAAAGGHRDP